MGKNVLAIVRKFMKICYLFIILAVFFFFCNCKLGNFARWRTVNGFVEAVSFEKKKAKKLFLQIEATIIRVFKGSEHIKT